MHASPAGEMKYTQYVVCIHPSDYALHCHKLIRMHYLEDPNLGGMVSCRLGNLGHLSVN